MYLLGMKNKFRYFENQRYFKRERTLAGPYGSDLRIFPEGPVYLYLSKLEWSDPWIKGGVIPLYPASKYLSSTREGTQTPDEMLQYRWDGAAQSGISNHFHIEGPCQDIQFINCSIDGIKFPDTRVDNYTEDTYVFCVSTKYSIEIQNKLNKFCCVEIKNISFLIDIFSDQSGINIYYGPIKYTKSSERSHFMKSLKDQWMYEYRIVIPGVESESIEFILPPGVGILL